MFLISLPKHELRNLYGGRGIPAKINGVSRMLNLGVDETLVWVDEDGEQVRPIITQTTDGLLVTFHCADSPADSLDIITVGSGAA